MNARPDDRLIWEEISSFSPLFGGIFEIRRARYSYFQKARSIDSTMNTCRSTVVLRAPVEREWVGGEEGIQSILSKS
jgi:hypothetical protein